MRPSLQHSRLGEEGRTAVHVRTWAADEGLTLGRVGDDLCEGGRIDPTTAPRPRLRPCVREQRMVTLTPATSASCSSSARKMMSAGVEALWTKTMSVPNPPWRASRLRTIDMIGVIPEPRRGTGDELPGGSLC